MADKKKLTQDIPLPPGVVLTPGYEVHEPEAPSAVASDRRVHADGSVDDVPHLSTYEAPKAEKPAPKAA